MTEKIKEALKKLDPNADVHWTKDGLPALNFVNIFASGKFTREQVEEAFPGFRRDKPEGSVLDDKAETDPAQQGAGEEVEPEEAARMSPDPQGAPLTANDPATGDRETGKTGEDVLAVTVHSNTAEGTTLEVENVDGAGKTISTDPPQAAAAGDQALVDAGAVELVDDNDIQADLQDKQGQLQELDGEIERLRVQRQALSSQIDDLLVQTSQSSQDSFQEANAGYFAQREKSLQQRAAQSQALQEAGITKKMIDAVIPKKAPIDEALSRRPRSR